MCRPLAAAACLCALLGAAGCGPSPPPPRLSVRVEPHEPLRTADFDDFLRVAEALGPDRLAPLREVLPAPADWPAGSTRTVAGLAEELREGVRRKRLGADLAASLDRTRTGPPLVRQVGWSTGRFASVGAAVGLAAVANDLTDELELRRLRAEAERKLVALFRDQRVFRTLDGAEAAAVRRRAAWIPRLELIDAALNCPPENRKLVSRRFDRLAPLLPAGFDRTALDRLLTDRERSAIPFHEPDAARDDALLRWDGTAVTAAAPAG